MAVKETQSSGKPSNKEDAESISAIDDLAELAFRGPRLDIASDEGSHPPNNSPIEITAPASAESSLRPNYNNNNSIQQQQNEKLQNVGRAQSKFHYPQPSLLEGQRRIFPPPPQLDAIHQNSMEGSAFSPCHPNSEQILKAHMNQMQMQMCMSVLSSGSSGPSLNGLPSAETSSSSDEHHRRLSLPGVAAQLSIMNMMHPGNSNRFQFTPSAPNLLNYGQAVMPSPTSRAFSMANRVFMPPIDNQLGVFHLNVGKSSRDDNPSTLRKGVMASNHNSILTLPKVDSAVPFQKQPQLYNVKNSNSAKPAALGSISELGLEYNNGPLMQGESASAPNNQNDMHICFPDNELRIKSPTTLHNNRTSMLKQLYQPRTKKRPNVSMNVSTADVDSLKPNKRLKNSCKNSRVNEDVAVAESGSQRKTQHGRPKQQEKQSQDELSPVVGMNGTESSLLLNSVQTKGERSTEKPKDPTKKEVGDKLVNWRCHKCHALCSDATRKQCNQCQAELTDSPMENKTDDDKALEWECVKCHTICPATRQRCIHCLAWHPRGRTGRLKKKNSVLKTAKDAKKGRTGRKTRSNSGIGEDAKCSVLRGRTKSTRSNSINEGGSATISKQSRNCTKSKRKDTSKYDAAIIDLVVDDSEQIGVTEAMKSPDKDETNSGLLEEDQSLITASLHSVRINPPNERDLLQLSHLSSDTSKPRTGLSPSCSFTASNPDVDYQAELGANLGDVFSEKDSDNRQHTCPFSHGVGSTIPLGEPQDENDGARNRDHPKNAILKTREVTHCNQLKPVTLKSNKVPPREINNKKKDENLITPLTQTPSKKEKLHDQVEYVSPEPGCLRQNTISVNQPQRGRLSNCDAESSIHLEEPQDEKNNAALHVKAERSDVTKRDLTADEKCLSALPTIDPADGLGKIANNAVASSPKKDTDSIKSIELSQQQASALTKDKTKPDAIERCILETEDSTKKESQEIEPVIHHAVLYENNQEEVDVDKFTAVKKDNEVEITSNIKAPPKKMMKRKTHANLVLSSKVSPPNRNLNHAPPEPISSKQETFVVNQLKPINDCNVAIEKRDNTDTEIIATSKTKSSTKKKKVANKKLVSQDMPAPSELCKVISEPANHINYPNAPMGSIWLHRSLHGSRSLNNTIDPSVRGTLVGRRWVWDEGYFVDAQFNSSSNPMIFPLPKCTCGSNHTTSSQLQMQRKNTNSSDASGRGARRSERSGTSTRMTSVLNELASGTLSPHTLIQCEEYAHGPEHRFSNYHPAEDVQPFSVRVSPDATFLADLHAHMCESEIIGFLSGWFSSEERCLYIQAAFPCRSTERIDSGQTDVEMDPVSQIYAREAIDSHGMSVVGWYHSHPTFQPDPSVTDIENQASYQQLFASSSSNLAGSVIPFVGLIIGTYDGRNPTSQSVMRWFHVRNQLTATYKNVQYPMNLKTTDRQFRKINDGECNSKQARHEMTTNGVDIRQAQETRYLSCILSESSAKQSFDEPINTTATNNTAMNVEVISEESELTRQNKLGGSSSQNSQNEVTVDLPEGNVKTKKVSTVLLSESILKQDSKVEPVKWRFPKAGSLYFTEAEKSMMEMPMMNGNDSCDVIGGIIWHAVEREQRVSKSSTNKSSLPLLPSEPVSSGAIFELILRHSFTSFCGLDKKLYDIIHCSEEIAPFDLSSDAVFQDSDAVIAHNVDTIISHYSTNPKKVSPFATWSGAGDKGNVIKSNGPTLVDDSNNKKLLDFYLTKILEMKRVELNGAVTYDGGAKKMRRGHKMTACLLKWASAMQLSPNYKPKANYMNIDTVVVFNHETKVQKKQHVKQINMPENMHYYFVAEVVRLIAAKWRECSGKSYSSTQIKRRDRRSTSKTAEKEEKNEES